MESFSAEIASREHHVYRGYAWSNITLNQMVEVYKENNPVSMSHDPYCCKTTVRKIDRIGPVTVGHIPREISQYVFYFSQEGGTTTGTVKGIVPKISPIPEGGLEIPLLLHFSNPKTPRSLRK